MASEKTLKEKIEVMIHYLGGGKITVNGWIWGQGKDKPPVFNWEKFDYSIYIEPSRKPSINWDHVDKEFNYLATNKYMGSYLFVEKPEIGDGLWNVKKGRRDMAVAGNFASFIPGTCDWKESLIKRPD